MAAYEHTAVANPVSVAAYKAVSLVTEVVRAVVAWNEARLTREALSRLSAAELDDIGLCRGDIDAVAFGRRS